MSEETLVAVLPSSHRDAMDKQDECPAREPHHVLFPTQNGRIEVELQADAGPSDDAFHVTSKRKHSDVEDGTEDRHYSVQRRSAEWTDEQPAVIDLQTPSDEEMEIEVVEEDDERSGDHHHGVRRRPAIELPADEELMEAVVSLEASFEDPSTSLRELWNTVARKVGDRFGHCGLRASMRFSWLKQVWSLSRHPEHPHLTDKLRHLLARNAATRKRRKDPTRKAVERRVKKLKAALSSRAATVTPRAVPAAPLLVQKDQFPVAGYSVHEAIDCELEEKVTRIVLGHAPSFKTTNPTRVVWEAIVRDSRGRYRAKANARIRTLWLCKVASTPEHPKHGELTSELRNMLLEVLDHWETATKPTSAVVDKKNDELLMKLVLKLRPFAKSDTKRLAVWAEIVRTVNHPQVRDAESGSERVRFLTKVFQNSSHAENVKLTMDLRVMLAKYTTMAVVFGYNRRESKRHLNARLSTAEVPARTSHPEPISTAGLACVAGRRVRPPISVPPPLSLTEVDPQGEPFVSPRAIQNDEPTNSSRAIQTVGQAILSTSTPSTSPVHDPPINSLISQVTKLEEEQRELRQELRAQRECHHHEMTAMLQLLEKERQDRKDEFTALMALATRYGAPHQVQTPTSNGTNRSKATAIEECLL